MSVDDRRGLVDAAGGVRGGEELNLERLQAYLGAHLEGFDGPLSLRQFKSGHSNLTYEISDGERHWVLRRPPFGSTVKTAHDMGREYRILSGLHRAYPCVPRAYLHCADLDVIGAEFYVMERVEGIILRQRAPEGFGLDADLARGLCESLVDNLARIHAVDLEVAGLSEMGRPQGYIERQVSGWTRRYFAAKTDEVPTIEAVAQWLAEKQPDSHEGALIHNDYKFDNVVLAPAEPTRIIGVLDWEMATVGHPLMDLGTALSYWVEPGDPDALKALAFGPTVRPGMFSRSQVINRYAQQTGRDVSAMDFYYAFGLFKTAVVVQQIYQRFVLGKTSDARFAGFGKVAAVLGGEAAQVIEHSRL